MQHIRVATYKMTRGTPEEVAALAASGMLEKFREHAGFIGYSLAKTDDAHIMSISVWKSHRDAEEAVALAADWVSENIADRISLEWNGVGDALFNANALGE